MHGKISFFSAKNGSGTIIDKNRRIYEFRMNAWHDTSTLPAAGLFVTFRMDENGKMGDCKASKYQDFAKEPYVSESEFWDTDDDEQLAAVEDDNLDEVVNAELDKLDIGNLEKVELVREPKECFSFYFYKYLDMLEKNRELMQKNPADLYDYAILKKYVSKALSQLLSLDKHASANDFSHIEQQISEVEYSLKNFKNQGDIKNLEIFKIFEKYQLKYLAVKKKLALLDDEVFEIETKIKSTNAEIERYRNKHDLTADDKEAIAKKSTYLNSLQNNAKERKKMEAKVKLAVESFEKYYSANLPKIYKEMRNSIYKDLRFLLNSLGDELDNKIHKTAMLSESVLNTYYKTNFEFPFCAMTFLHVYLKRLDKSKMQQRDIAAHNLYNEFEKGKLKKYLLISDSENIASSMRRYVLHLSKYNSLYLFYKPIEFFTQAKNIEPEIIMIDLDTSNLEVEEIIKKTKAIFGNTTRIVLFSRTTGD